MDDIDPDFFGNRFRDALGVASQKDGANSQRMKSSHGLFGLRSQGVRDSDSTEIHSIAGDKYLGRGISTRPCTVKNNVVVPKKCFASYKNSPVIRATIDPLARSIFEFFRR